MARTKETEPKRPIESYEHKGKRRANNPQVGLVTPYTDPDVGQKKNIYTYDPHLDPQLVWAGKAEHTSFQVPTVSLHVHERIDPRTIIEAVRKHNGDVKKQITLFEILEENLPLRQAIEFYKHAHGWSNRLVAGDSLLVMNSLLEKEGLAGKVQMIYVDPPYGIRYGSNFQPFVNKRDVKDGKDEDLTSEPEQIKAFRDTWELGIHSYLSYLRDRLLLARELLTESGSVFVQISDENVHHVRELMDEVFGTSNFSCFVPFRKRQGRTSSPKLPEQTHDFLLWYCKDRSRLKYRQLYIDKDMTNLELFYDNGDEQRIALTDEQKRGRAPLPVPIGEIYTRIPLELQTPSPERMFAFEWKGQIWPHPPKGWSATDDELRQVASLNRLTPKGKYLLFKRFYIEYGVSKLTSVWNDTAGEQDSIYAVQTNPKPIERCLLMTTDPGDLVFDPTCGSGTTAYVAEQWGRRWITCDTSRVALTLAKQRLMTAVFDYYELAHPNEGVGSGFKYKKVPHVTLKSIANNPDIREGMTRAQIDAAIARHAPQETLYDQPLVDRKKKRVSGPFTVEAVPAPTVAPLEQFLVSSSQFSEEKGQATTQNSKLTTENIADSSIARMGETLRQAEWRDELLRTGIRGKSGQYIRFSRLEPLPGCRFLHADGETRPSSEGADSVREEGTAYAAQRIVVSFGPEHAPLEQRQVEQAIEEAQTLVPKPKLIVFAAFQFDPEATKDIDEINWPGVTLLKAQMNADLLTEDLKKKRVTNESFWLIGQPDVEVERMADGVDKGRYRVYLHGFDYYNTKTGGIESGGADKIAVWLLDTDYDGRSLYPQQVFFPMAGENDGWTRLARNLKAEIDVDLMEAYHGTISLPFSTGAHKRIAVKIVDDRGIESLKVMEVE